MKRYAPVLFAILMLSNVVFGQIFVNEKANSVEAERTVRPELGIDISQLFGKDDLKQINASQSWYVQDGLSKNLFVMGQCNLEPPQRWARMRTLLRLDDGGLDGAFSDADTAILTTIPDGYNKVKVLAIDNGDDFQTLVWDAKRLISMAMPPERSHLSGRQALLRM